MQIISWNVSQYIIAGTTLRSGGVSSGSLASLNLALNVHDKPQNVIENRQRLASHLGLSLAMMVSPTQTHSTHLQQVFAQDAGRGMTSLADAFDDTDALYTKEKNICLLTYHADCIPVLLYDPQNHLIASIHAGWKGNVKEIILKTLRHLSAKENCQAKNIYAYIGPSLGYEAFEARQDIISLVDQMEINGQPFYHETAPGIYHLDAKGLAQEQLLYFGVPKDHITIDPHCTKTDESLFFSYRRDHQCGRHASFIMLKD